MNRHERRKAHKLGIGEAIFMDHGTLDIRDRNFGRRVICYACGARHLALNFARIRTQADTTDVPLCPACFASNDMPNDVLRKFLNAPDMTIEEGGNATLEQIDALVEREHERETEH
jgi:hypothetical protein